MKPFIVLAALVAASQANPLQGVSDSLLQSVIRAKWSSFKAEHAKDYSGAEEPQRLQQYLETTMTIEEHNARFHAGLESFSLGHNQFSDMTQEELTSQKLGLRLPSLDSILDNATYHVHTGVSAPGNTFDWGKWGGVQEVKDQGSCGSCYSFSAIGALESARWRSNSNRDLPNLSEQQAVDCSRGHGNYGCDGGWMHNVFRYINEHGGCAAQGSYRYTGTVDRCRHRDQGMNLHSRVARWTMVRASASDLLNALTTHGCISIAYCADGARHFNYNGGTISYAGCPTQPNHAVLLVGYGTENGMDYWYIKNSWGKRYGLNGYFKMERGKNMCGCEGPYNSYPSCV